MPVVLFAAEPDGPAPASRRVGLARVIVVLLVAGIFFMFSKSFFASPSSNSTSGDDEAETTTQVSLSIPSHGSNESGSQTLDGAGSKTKTGDDQEFATPEEQWSHWFVGKWEQKGEEHSVLTAKVDGTATIFAKISGAKSYVVGEELTLNVDWKIANGELTFNITGGKPKVSYQIVTEVFGTERTYKINDFTAEKIQLTNPKGEKSAPWKRIADDKQ